jgi:hypothetical protein
VGKPVCVIQKLPYRPRRSCLFVKFDHSMINTGGWQG